MRVSDGSRVVFEHQVEGGDIWRMCQTKHEPIVVGTRPSISLVYGIVSV